MTKQQEIDALRKFTASLPQDSYLRPWLDDVLPQVEQDIRNDFPVSPSLSRTRQDCVMRENECAKLCRDAREQTRRDCDTLERQAHQRCQNIRNNLINATQQAFQQLTA